MLRLVAHGAPPIGPEALWSSWHLDPLLLATLAIGAVVCVRDAVRAETRRALLIAGALLVVAVAVVSPLDAAARSLAAAHMVQHVLLIAAAAPLLALALLPSTRRLARVRSLRLAGAITVAHAVALAGWHAAVPYEAALRHDLVHVAEHGSFLATGVLFWAVVAGLGRASFPHRILLVFAIAMETVFIGVLMTFAPAPWYDPYLATTQAWGVAPLADQQFAGVIMWVPMAAVYVGAALVLVTTWLHESPDVVAL